MLPAQKNEPQERPEGQTELGLILYHHAHQITGVRNLSQSRKALNHGEGNHVNLSKICSELCPKHQIYLHWDMTSYLKYVLNHNYLWACI